MANIKALADSTVKLKTKLDPKVGWKLAAMQAVERSGITHKPDVIRLSGAVIHELSARGISVQRAKRRQATVR